MENLINKLREVVNRDIELTEEEAMLLQIKSALNEEVFTEMEEVTKEEE